MAVRSHLFVTAAPVALGYASQPLTVVGETPDPRGVQDAETFERRSADSAHMLKYWDKVDAVLGGVDSMRDNADEFLPRFRDEENEDYTFRKNCTKFTNVYRDIVEGLSAKPFEQMVQLIDDQTDQPKIPEEIKQFIWDVDGSGNNLTVFAAHTFFEGVNHAVDWIMVDHDKRDPSIRSMADAKARGLRPYWSHVLGRNVLNVQSRIEGGKEVITYIKILEPGEPQHIREFERTDTFDQASRRITAVEWRLWQKRGADVNGGRACGTLFSVAFRRNGRKRHHVRPGSTRAGGGIGRRASLRC